MMDANILLKLAPGITRQLREAKASCPVTVHQKIDNAVKLIERLTEEINGTINDSPTGGTQSQPE